MLRVEFGLDSYTRRWGSHFR